MIKSQRIFAIGILLIGILVSSCNPSEQATATATSVPSTETPISTNTSQPTLKPTETSEVPPALTIWKEIPIFPDTISGNEDFGDYQFKTESPARIITAYYQQEMVKLGWQVQEDMMASTSSDLVYKKDNTFVFFLIKPEGNKNIVYIHPVQE